MKDRMTPATREVLVRALGAGVTIETACEIAGVHRTTFHRWMRGTRPVAVRFQKAVERARSAAAAAAPAPMGEDELRRLVAAACRRRNSMAALKLQWAMVLEDRRRAEGEDGDGADDGTLAELDELAAARARRR